MKLLYPTLKLASPDISIEEIVSELWNDEYSDNNRIPKIGKTIGDIMEARSPEIHLFESEKLIPEIFLNDSKNKQDEIEREKSILYYLFHPTRRFILSPFEFFSGTQVYDSKVIESMEEDISKSKYKERIMPNDSIEPDKESHQYICIFEHIYPASLEWSETLKEDVNEYKKNEDNPDGREESFGELYELAPHKPDVIPCIEMTPPIENGNSCNKPTHSFIHDSIDRFLSFFFWSIYHNESELLFDEVIYRKESDEVYEPLTTTITVDKNRSDNPHNKGSYHVEFLVFSEFHSVEITSIKWPINMCNIEDDDEKEKPKRIILNSEILWEVDVHYPCKNPHKEKWGKEENRVVGARLDVGYGHIYK